MLKFDIKQVELVGILNFFIQLLIDINQSYDKIEIIELIAKAFKVIIDDIAKIFGHNRISSVDLVNSLFIQK
jgi:hypothetical protein